VVSKVASDFFSDDVFFSRIESSIEKICDRNDVIFPKISPKKLTDTLNYSREFLKWNRSYNMTALTDPEEFLIKHIIDCLTVLPYIDKNSIIDIGTGGGLPGVLIAIFFPEKKVALLDSVGKKTRFLFHIKTRLQLSNVEIFHQRAEKHQPETPYDGVTSRAFSTLDKFVTLTDHLLAPGGCFFALKGQQPDEELRQMKKGYNVDACHQLHVPELLAERHLVILSKTD